MLEFHFEKFEGRKTLIIGEAGSGKTKLTASLLSEALESVKPEDITVLDFAPPKIRARAVAAGGKIADFLPNVKKCHSYMSSESIRAPRLEGRDASEVWKIAGQNATLTSSFIESYLSSPTPYLFVNDLTIYMHAGDVSLLLEAIQKSRTFVGNAYNGSALAPDQSSGLSERERELLQKVTTAVDAVIDLSSLQVESR